MKLDSLEDVFNLLLSDIYHVELELLTAIPAMAKKAKSEELKEGLRRHLEETKEQVKRLEQAFNILGIVPKRVDWNASVHALFEKGASFLHANTTSAPLDAAIIVIAQRVEHFEIATYGSLIEFCKVLDHVEVRKLLEETIKEEYNADKALNKVAEGGAFSAGVNVKAAR